MQTLLIAFIDTLDQTMKQFLTEAGVGTGLSRLTLNQVRYIEAIGGLDHPTISEVADRLGITKASVTAGVNRLVALGYASKTQSSMDKRVFHVSLTPDAQHLLEARTRTLEAYGQLIRDALSPQELDQFQTILEKLVARFHSA